MTFKHFVKSHLPDDILIALLAFVAPVRASYYRRKNVGQGSFLDKTVHVLGWKSVRVGENTSICEGTCININNRTFPGYKVDIGNNCFIGRHNFFTNGHSIIISDYFMSGANCSFIGGGHSHENPFLPYIATIVADKDKIFVGANCWLGIGVTVVGNVKLGHGSIIGAGALVTKDVPPFSIAVGNPARTIKRYDIKSKRWVFLTNFTNEMESLLPNEPTYLEMLKKNKPDVKMAFAAIGKSRGDLP